MVHIARLINLSFITRVMLYQTLPIGTTFHTVPALSLQEPCYQQRWKHCYLKIIINFLKVCRVREKSIKYIITMEIKIQVYMLVKGDENVNSIDR